MLVTSLLTDETPADSLDALASDGEHVWLARSPKLPVSLNGAGDAIAAMFFVHWLETGSPAAALGRAMSSVYGLLKRTADAGSREILLIAAQNEIVAPTWPIAVVAV